MDEGAQSVRGPGGEPVAARNGTSAAILCPGPSLKKAIPQIHESFIVTVTDAVFVSIPFDVWVMTENPTGGKREFYREVLMEKRPLIWGLSQFERRWHTMMKLGAALKLELNSVDGVIEQFPYVTTVPAPITRARENGRWSRGPTFYAIANCISKGYKDINLYGCDFRGAGNFHPVSGATLGRAGQRPYERWRGERKHFDDIRDEASQHGVRLRRVLPPVDDYLGGSLDDEGDGLGSPQGSGDSDQQSPLHQEQSPD